MENLTKIDGEENPSETVEIVIPPEGTKEWLQYLSEFEGHLPTPINISITGSTVFKCPELKWFNFDVYPHKIKMTNTGYTLVISTKWRTERPYLEGGPFLEKHVLSQIHFHWGADMTEGSDHTVDGRRYPGEMQKNVLKQYEIVESDEDESEEEAAMDILEKHSTGRHSAPRSRLLRF